MARLSLASAEALLANLVALSRGRLQHSRNCPEGGVTCALSEMHGQLKIFPSW